MTDDNSVTVHLLNRPFRVKCKKEKAEQLQRAAFQLDEQMREIRDGGKLLGLDRIAIIAALNLSHELLSIHDKNAQKINEMNNRLKSLQQKIDEVLPQNEEMEL